MFAAKLLYVVPTDKLPPTYVAPEDEIAPATVRAVDGVVVPIPTLPPVKALVIELIPVLVNIRALIPFE